MTDNQPDNQQGMRTRFWDRFGGDQETAKLERGYRLVMNSVYVVAALFVVALVGMWLLDVGVKAGVVSAMLTAVTGVIGSLVGAYFGIQVGSQGREQVEERAQRAESRAEDRRHEAEVVARRALAVVPPEGAAAALGDSTLGGGEPPAG